MKRGDELRTHIASRPHSTYDKIPREFTVADGGDEDKCLLCGIHRVNAGYLKATCGDDFLKPGCFVVRAGGAEGDTDA